MRILSILLAFVFIFSLALKAQGIYDNDAKFMQLAIKNKNLELQLNNINTEIFSKSNGSEYPLCKMVFSKDNYGMIKIAVEAIDNGWGNLFRADQLTYGYVILDSRMFWVMAQINGPEIDLNELFFGSDIVRSFNTKPALSKRILAPTWVISQDYNNRDFFDIMAVSNLELLGK